jgi:hypothetical protein
VPRGSNARPGGALIIVVVVLCAILVIYDISSPHSVLASFLGELTRSPTQGEQMRDDVLDQMRVRR